MITLILNLVTALYLAPSPVVPPKGVAVNQNYLYQHWVMSPKESDKGTIVYRPYQIAEKRNIPKQYRYAGMMFEKGGKLRKYRWRRSGNRQGPAFYRYNWRWKKSFSKKTILNIASKVGNGQNYEVMQLSKNILKIRMMKRH